LIASFIVRLSWLARHDIRRTAGFGRRILDGGRFGFVRWGFRCFLRWILDVTLAVIVVLHAFTPRCCGFRRLRYQRLCHGSTIRANRRFHAKHWRFLPLFRPTSSSGSSLDGFATRKDYT
jgi:hypothetical protein